MKVPYINQPDNLFLDPSADLWNKAASAHFNLSPTPIKMVQHLSPFMANSTEHGKISRIDSRVAHNGSKISILLSWEDATKNDEIRDLDQFIDGVAVMFPFTPNANPLTMGDEDNPVNAWMWRADQADPFDVIAHGFGSSKRRPGKDLGLSVNSVYDQGRWMVVFQRTLRTSLISHKQVNFAPDKATGISFAVWDGGNEDRSAQKSFSGQWEPMEMEA
jgi:DMSO reductase family type II enzyme heme b subunit